MKRITSSLLGCLLLLILASCSSVTVLDSWKSDTIANVKDHNFLVVARANSPETRLTFENEIVDQLKSKGYQATASFAKFGNLKPNNPDSDLDKEQLKALLQQEGFDAIILTVMKDHQEKTRVQKEGGFYTGGNYLGYYPNYYGGFYQYYYNPLSFYTPSYYVPETVTTSTSSLYILETTVYDLTAAEGKQLVAVITSKVDNPESAGEAAGDYVKEISKRFE